MGSLHTILLSAGLLAGALTLSPQAAYQDEIEREGASSHSQFFPTPSLGMVIRNRESQNLVDLLAEFSAVSGENILYSNETRQQLAASSTQLITDLVVAPQDVYAVVQDILAKNHFALIDLRREEPRMMGIEQDGACLQQPARFVPMEELEDYALDSALLITTVIEMPNTSVYRMEGRLRNLNKDRARMYMSLVPLSESGQVVVTGLAEAVYELSQVLRRIDEGAGRYAEAMSSRRAANHEHQEEDKPDSKATDK